MKQCSATKKNGDQCAAPAVGSSSLCWAHNPVNQAKRKKTASRGGRGKAAKRLQPLWDEIKSVIAGVESERLNPSQGNSMIRGYHALILLARLEIEKAELEIAERRLDLDVEERTELRRRLEELEEEIDARTTVNGHRSLGA
jgi:hypothetical protein